MRGWISIIILSLFVAPFLMAQQKIDEFSESGDCLAINDAVGYTTDAVKALKLHNDRKSAKDLLLKAIESDSTYAPAYYQLSELMTYSSADSAYYYAQKAYNTDSLNTWYIAAYAQSAAMMESYEEAKTLFKELLVLQPRDVNAYRVLALLYNQQKQPTEAVAILDTAEVKVGQNPFLTNLKRQILISNNQSDRVIEEALAAIEQEPLAIENRVTLAEVYRDLKRDSLALVEYNNAIAMDSTRLETLLSMGDFLKAKGDRSGYIKLLNQIFKSDQIDLKAKISIIEEFRNDREVYSREYLGIGALITTLIVQHPNNEQLIEMQAMHLMANEMLDEALVMLKGHLDGEPASLKLHRMVIDIERYKERPDSVAYYLDRAITKFPEETDLEFEWAYTLTTQGRYDEAIELYKGHLVNASDSTSSTIWGIIGDVHHQVAIANPGDKKLFKQRLKLSYKAYDEALSFMPNNIMVLNNYAYFLCEYGGDLNRALVMAKRSTQLDESNSTFIDTYAWILHKLGFYDEAKVQMRRAISLDTTKNGEIALHYGEILAVLGETTMANHYWGKAIEWGISEEQVEASRRAAAELMDKR